MGSVSHREGDTELPSMAGAPGMRALPPAAPLHDAPHMLPALDTLPCACLSAPAAVAGFVMRRLRDSCAPGHSPWSAPCYYRCRGIGLGAVAGVQGWRAECKLSGGWVRPTGRCRDASVCGSGSSGALHCPAPAPGLAPSILQGTSTCRPCCASTVTLSWNDSCMGSCTSGWTSPSWQEQTCPGMLLLLLLPAVCFARAPSPLLAARLSSSSTAGSTAVTASSIAHRSYTHPACSPGRLLKPYECLYRHACAGSARGAQPRLTARRQATCSPFASPPASRSAYPSKASGACARAALCGCVQLVLQ